MGPRPLLLFLLPVLATSWLIEREARADLTSWLAGGTGYAFERNRVAGATDYALPITYSLGVGSPPVAPLVLGGLVRGTTFINLGTDLGFALRGSTGGFARGDWGVAIDVGALWRPWRDGSYGAWPLQEVVTIGAPWGFQLALGAELGSLTNQHSAVGGFVVLEMDFLRLTVLRQGPTEKWWPNPAPAGGREAQGAGLAPSAFFSSAFME